MTPRPVRLGAPDLTGLAETAKYRKIVDEKSAETSDALPRVNWPHGSGLLLLYSGKCHAIYSQGAITAAASVWRQERRAPVLPAIH